jgi:ribonuclease R
MSSERLAGRILKFVASAEYRPQQERALARAMGIADDEYGDFHDAVKALMKSGRVIMGATQALTLPEPGGRVFGTFRANPRGFGFVIPDAADAHGDLYIPEGQSKGALTGDVVRAIVRKRGKRGSKMLFEGQIVEIISRGNSRYVGELQRGFGQWFVRPDGNTFHAPIFVGDVGAKSAAEGDQVVVEITEYPAPGRDARGVILEVLGRRGAAGVDLRSIIRQYGFPTEFPDDVQAEARRVIADYDLDAALRQRDDLRTQTIITIDPDTARDFDDAISLAEARDGRIELGVHIADVAHFVVPGGVLDRTARERSNSIYFPNHVIPMLPEILSNGLCSLQEAQPRLTKSAFITYDGKGRVVSTRFANSVIRSTKRLTYGEATAILAGQVRGYDRRVVELLRAMERLAKLIQQRRIRAGMLVLTLPEVEVVLNEAGEVVGVQPEDTAFSHTLIEMFMVEANEAVGRLLRGLNVPNLRRIHPEPGKDAHQALGRFLNALGIKAPKTVERHELQRLLREAAGRPVQFAANLAVLRSMQRAVYSPKPVGHFALASEDYVHFTSPIRRYPDLTIHRLLDAHLRGVLRKRGGTDAAPTMAAVEALGQLCSTNERLAENAERELKLVYILRLLEKRVGEVFEGIVTGVANFGMFVQLPQYLVEGLLRFTDLPDDWWEVDADAGRVVGGRTGRQITIGDRLSVTVAAVDLATRKIDLVLAKPLSAPRARKGPPPAAQPKAGPKSGPKPRRPQQVRPPQPSRRRRKR